MLHGEKSELAYNTIISVTLQECNKRVCMLNGGVGGARLTRGPVAARGGRTRSHAMR